MSDTGVSKKRKVQGDCSRVDSDSASDGEPSSSKRPESTAPTTHGLKSFLHGITYQLKITTLILCEAAEQHKKENGFKFSISCEDPEGGKFDDIGFKYGDGRRLFVQAKHAMVRTDITWGDLTSSDQQAPFAIGKYFASFLDNQWDTSTTLPEFVLLTNNGLSDDVIQCMKSYSFEDVCVKSIFKSLGSTLYKFDFEILKDKYPNILECLNEFSDIVCLAKKLAECIFKGNLVDLRNPLFKKYRSAIGRDIAKQMGVDGTRKRKPEKKKGVLEIQDIFLNDSITYDFKTEFQIQYKKISGMVDVWGDVKKKGIRLSDKFYSNSDSDLELPKYVEMEQKRKFFDSLVISCNTKDDESLAGDIIGKLRSFNTYLPYEMEGWREAEMVYGELTNIMLDWMKRKQNEPLNENLVADFLNPLVSSIFYLYLKGISKFNCAELQQTDLQLDPAALTKTQFYINMKSWLSKNDCSLEVEEYGYNNIPLIAWQVLVKLCENFHESKLQYLIINRNSFVQKQDEIMNAFCGLDSALILAIDCKSSDIEEMRNTLQPHYSNLGKSAKSFQHRKKIIFLRKYETNETNLLKISDLSSASKTKFYNGNKKFFGAEFFTKLLFRDDDAFRLALDATHSNEIMEQDIVNEKFTKIKKKYINRTWKRYDRKNTTRSDTFWYSKAEGSRQYFKMGPSTNETDLLNFSDRYNRRKPPPGVKYGEVNGSGVDIKDSAKVFIFLDEAGSGKSFYLTWLANELKVMFPTWWVVKFNMIEYSFDFSWLMENHYDQNMTTQQAVRILFQFIYLVYYAKFAYNSSEDLTEKEREKSRQCANALYYGANCIWLDEEISLTTEQIILLRLFQNKFNEKKLVLVFDGFDEIAPNYNYIALTFLHEICQSNGVHKMYLSSRPYDYSRDFEGTLKSCMFYQFNCLDRLDTLIFIDRFLSHSEQYCDIYNKKNDWEKHLLRVELFGILNKNLENLSQIPLFLEIGLDFLLYKAMKNQDDFIISRLDSPEMRKEYEKTLEVLNLLEFFIEKKWKIAIKEKTGVTEASAHRPLLKNIFNTEKEKCNNVHTLLAYRVIFNKTQRSFLSDVERNDAMKYATEVKQGSVNYGIIEGMVGDVPLFIHRLFAEYYAAKGMYEKSLTDKGDDIKLFLKNNVYHRNEHSEVRFFLDRMLCKDRPLHMAIINKSPTAKLILENNPSAVKETDKWGRSPLHLAVLYNPRSIIDLLIEKLKPTDINVCDKYLEWTALDNVFSGHKMHIVCALIENGGSIKTPAMFQKLHSKDLLKMFFNVIYFEYFLFNKYLCDRRQLLPEGAIDPLLELVADEIQSELNLQITPSDELIKDVQRMFDNFEVVGHWINECFKYITLSDGKPSTWTLIEWCVVYDSKLFQILVGRAGGCDKVFSKEHSEKLFKLACEYRAPYALQYMLASSGFILQEFREFADILVKLMLNKSIDKQEEKELVARYNQLSSIPECLLKWDDWNCFHLALRDNNPMFAKFFMFKLSLLGNNEVFLKILSQKPSVCNAACHFLCDTNKNLYIVDEKGRNLLQIAILNDCLGLVKCLVDHYNFNVKQVNESENKWHAFFYCVTTECLPNEKIHHCLLMFKHMLEQNPIDCFREKDALGNNVINYALKNNFLITEYIISKLPFDKIEETNANILLEHFENANIDVEDIFSIIKDKVSSTVLKSFCNQLHNRNKLHTEIKMGRNLLQMAVMKGWLELVQLLIQHFDFKPTEINEHENNWNAFFYCAMYYSDLQLDIWKYMWDNETVDYLNQKDTLGKNIFHYAAKRSNYVAGFVVLREIEKEMEYFTENEMHSLWRLFAVSDLDLEDFFTYLKDNLMMPVNEDCEDSYTLDEKVLECACNALANANVLYTKMQMGRNLLHIAAKEGWLDVIKYLIVHRQFKLTDINEQENGWNAFFYCVAEKNGLYNMGDIFSFMMDSDPVDCFGLHDSKGKSIFFYALHNFPAIADYILIKEFKANNSTSMNDRCSVFFNRLTEINLPEDEMEQCLQKWERISSLPDKVELYEHFTGTEPKPLDFKNLFE